MEISNTAPDSQIQHTTVTLEIPPAIVERIIPVPESNWSRLESRIRSIVEVGSFFDIAAGAFVGIMITTFAAAYTLPGNSPNFWSFIIIGIAGLVGTVLSCVFAYRQKKCIGAHKADILDEMGVLKHRYIPDQDET